MRYTRPDGSDCECQIIGRGLSGDPLWPIRIRARIVGPFAGPWQEFDTEPAWLVARGLPVP